MTLLQDSTLITSYFPQLTATQNEQFKALGSLYLHWNKQINLISRKDIEHLYLHHVLHSLSIAKVIQFQQQAVILDVGTGGGFPGLPLAILFPQTQFVLVDSIKKKIKAVENIVEKIELQNVTLLAMRAEEVVGSYDFVIARGVTRLATLYGWIGDKLKKKNRHALQNGLLYLKGKEIEEPLHKLSLQRNFYFIREFFQQPFFATKIIAHLFPVQGETVS